MTDFQLTWLLVQKVVCALKASWVYPDALLVCSEHIRDILPIFFESGSRLVLKAFREGLKKRGKTV